MKISKSNIAAQLFTARELIQTADGLEQTLKRLKGYGYQAAQVSGIRELAPETIRKIFDENEMVLCATHENGREIVENTGEVIRRLQAMGCTQAAYPSPHYVLDSREAVLRLAEDLEAAGKRMREAGVTLSFHNHAREMFRYDGKTILELLYENTSRENLKAEIDTYWIQAGGQNPVRWIERFSGNQPLIHFKDLCIVDPANNDVIMTEVGNGNLDWDEIVPAAEKGGVEWFIIEQDRNWVDPVESLGASYRFLVEHYV